MPYKASLIHLSDKKKYHYGDSGLVPTFDCSILTSTKYRDST